MAATEIVAVLDAGPLIHLDQLGRLGLLSDFKELLVPQAVLDEALVHRPGMRLNALSNVEIITESPPLRPNLLKLADEFALHAGERAALAVLESRGGHFLLSDDAAARAVAQAVGFQTHGTIGLILRSHRRGQISRTLMLQLLRDLPEQTTLHIQKDFLAGIIAKAETESV